MPLYIFCRKDKMKLFILLWNIYTPQTLKAHCLFSKPRRSLCRLRLKFEETTRVVCTDYSWSLQKILRTYKFKYAYSPP